MKRAGTRNMVFFSVLFGLNVKLFQKYKYTKFILLQLFNHSANP